MKAYNDLVKKRHTIIDVKTRELLKKTISELGQIHNKDLNGDEVQEIARTFTKMLCEFNAEEDQYNSIIRRWPNSKKNIGNEEIQQKLNEVAS